jgi:trans-aconitate methyltransferase
MNWNPEDYAKNSSAQLGWARALIARMNFKGTESVLDVGCGDGKITAEIARAIPNGYVLGTDNSPAFIDYAREHYPPSLFGSLEFQLMDARALQVQRHFDLIFSNAVLHWVDNHPEFLRGAERHLEPGGRLVLSCGGGGRNASEIIPTIEAIVSSETWREHFEGFAFPYHFHDAIDYQRWLPEAGLSPLRCELVERDMTHDGAAGLAAWIRTTWLPYTQRIPEALRESFVEEIVSTYLTRHPFDNAGRTHVRMNLLEVEAVKPR